MPLWLTCLLLALDVGALAVLRTKYREKKKVRAAVSFACVLLAVFLLGYLALAAIFLNAAYHQ